MTGAGILPQSSIHVHNLSPWCWCERLPGRATLRFRARVCSLVLSITGVFYRRAMGLWHTALVLATQLGTRALTGAGAVYRW